MSTLGGFVQIGNGVGITKSSQVGVNGPSNINGGDDVIQGYNDADYATIQAMRTRLTAINGAYFTTALLNSLSYNDLQYALTVVGP